MLAFCLLPTIYCLLLFPAATHGDGYNDQAGSVQQTRDAGHIIVAGGTTLPTPNDPDFLVFGPGGGVDWQKLYGESYIDIVGIVQQTRDGGYIVPGRTRSFGTGKDDLWVLKLKADGTIEWQKTCGGNYADAGGILQQTNDRGYIMVDYTYTKSSGAEKYDAWALKLGPDGTVEWQKTYGGNYDGRGRILLQTNDGGYIVAGWTESSGAGKKDRWVLRLRPDGSFCYAQDKSIDPACESVKETDLSVKDSNATVKDTTVSPVNSHANPRDSSAIVQDTNVPVDLFCLPTSRP